MTIVAASRLSSGESRKRAVLFRGRDAYGLGILFFSMATFIGSYLYLIEELKTAAFALFSLSAVGLYFIGISKESKAFEVDFPITSIVIAGLFLYVSLFAALLNHDIEIALGASFIFLFYIVSLLVMRRPMATSIVVLSFLIATFVVIVLSLWVKIPTIGGSYQGVFNNPNALGGVLATCAAVLIAKSMNVRGFRLTFYVAAIFGVTVLTLLTRNRAAIGAIVACFAVIVVLWLPTVAFRIRSFVTMVVACAVVPFLTSLVWTSIIQPVIDKFLYNESTSLGITSGRTDIWMAYLSESTLLGRGRDILNMFDHAAHNTYISLIAQFGWVAGILFLVFVLIILVQTWFSRNRPFSGYLGFMSTLVFFILSLSEGMLMKSTMFTMLLFSSASVMSKAD